MPRPATPTGVNGRAASCTRTASTSAGIAARARRNDSLRSAPPGTTMARGTRRRTSSIASAGAATTTISTPALSSVAHACTTSGNSPIRTNAFGTGWPSRSPRPAAGTIAAMRIGRSMSVDEVREDEPAVRRRDDAGDPDGDFLTDQPAALVDDDHRAVVEVADTLTGLAARLDQLHGDVLAGDDRRA